MTSILTNTSAMAALQTLRSVNSSLEETQKQISSGLRIQTASDNAAYWSISTTMRSDKSAISAVSDAIGLGQAKVDTAYNGLNAVLDVLTQFKAKLVATTEAGVDKDRIQQELDQYKQQVQGIAYSSSFNGQNWLVTNIEDIYDVNANSDTVVSSFVRDSAGNVSVNSTGMHLSETSLFNSTGGGLLQKDGRDAGSIGGIRYWTSWVDGTDVTSGWNPYNGSAGSRGTFDFTFAGPLSFSDAGDQISFDVTVDADNPADGIDPPYAAGKTTSVTIDRSTIDAVNASWNGVISSYTQYQQVLSYALSQANTGAAATTYVDNNGQPIIDRIGIYTREDRSTGLNGSYVEVSNFSSNVGSGGLGNAADYGTRGSKLTLDFTPFQDYKDGDDPDGIIISFSFSINGAAAKSYSFDRTYVNNLLGVENGKVETSEQMVTLLKSLMSSDWPTLKIDADSPSSVTVQSDPALDRLSGAGTSVRFSNFRVSNEPLATINFMDIDVASNPDKVSDYLTYIETVRQKITAGAAQLGSLQKRLDGQSNFTASMMDSIDKSVGKLVDADMEEASNRLAAQQTQQQLAVQALSIANAAPTALLALFR
ncbi:flagellin/flagellar hook associated protein [Agrobacterium rhizogenes]|uniref:flagellin N-terminal helical domain-containing protein n=1 Tax=Rhizobium rhizogenes TaxID=359 RepID=UPI0015723EE7|nr:flagellin [Rhizobium rhizogenes]NTG51613.1 flagellin/flagellar hook associated protein [Rhizobium rhizogenes]